MMPPEVAGERAAGPATTPTVRSTGTTAIGISNPPNYPPTYTRDMMRSLDADLRAAGPPPRDNGDIASTIISHRRRSRRGAQIPLSTAARRLLAAEGSPG